MLVNEDEFEYRSYRIHCFAKTTSNRRFTAGIVVTRVTPERLVERHFAQAQPFATKREALEHAREVGMAWIDAQGQLPTVPPASGLTAGSAPLG